MNTLPDEASRSTPTRIFGLSCASAGVTPVASIALAAMPNLRRVNFIRLARQTAHLFDQIRFAFKTDARQIRHRDIAVLDLHAIGNTAIVLEQVGIGFVAAEAETGGDVERHLVAALRAAALRRPAVALQHVERPQIFDEAIAQRAIELQPVAVSPHAAVADEIARVLHGEEVLAGRRRLIVMLREFRLQFEIEGIAGLLVPEEIVGRESLGIIDRGWQ